MKTPALISCVVPAYNSERYIGEALDSILAQTYRPVEIIVADDGSTDGTAQVAARFDQHVRFLTQDVLGPPATRNLGIRAAQGEFVAFLDADDVWHPDKLARQMARFEARSELGLCVTHVQNFWIPELQEEAERFRTHRSSQALPGYYTGTLLARRSLFETVGLLNPALWHTDATDWFLRAEKQAVLMELLPDVLTYHRMHRTNLSRRKGAIQEEFLHTIKASLDERRARDGTSPRPYTFPASDRSKDKDADPCR